MQRGFGKGAPILLSLWFGLCATAAWAGEDDVRVMLSPSQATEDPRISRFDLQAVQSYAAGDLRAAVAAAESGLAAAATSTDTAMLAFCLNNAGFYNQELGKLQVALGEYEQARQINRRLLINTGVTGGDTVMAAYSNLCALYEKMGRHRESKACLTERQAVIDERRELLSGKTEAEPELMPSQPGRSPAQSDSMDAGKNAAAAGEFQKAIELYTQALQSAQASNADAKGRILREMGLALGRSHRAKESAETLAKAAASFASISDIADEADCLEQAVEQERKTGQYLSAAAHEVRALSLTPRVRLARRQAATAEAEAARARREMRDAEALKGYQKALTGHKALGMRAEETSDLLNIAGMFSLLKEKTSALDYAQQALGTTEAGSFNEGQALMAIGDALQALGRPMEAVESYRKATADFRSMGYEEMEANALWNLGGAWSALNDGRQAILCFNRGIRLSEKLKNLKTAETLRLNVAMLVERLNDPDLTQQVWRSKLDVDRRSNFEAGISEDLRRLGDVAKQRGRHLEAVNYFRQALQFIHKGVDIDNEPLVLFDLADALNGIDDRSAAMKVLDEGLIAARSKNNRPNEVAMLTMIAVNRTELGDFLGATRYGGQALDLARRLGDHHKIAETENSIGYMYDRIGDYDEGMRHFQLALPEAEKTGDKNLVIGVLGSMGNTAAELGDWNKAVDYEQRMLKLNNWGGGVVNLGYAYMGGKRYDEATAAFKRVGHTMGLAHIDLIQGRYAAALAVFSSDIKEYEKARDFPTLLPEYSGQGLALEGLGRYAEAAASYRKGQALLERIRDGLNENERLHFLASEDFAFPRLEPHEGMVRVLPFLSEGLRGSLYAAEFTRARVFAEAAARLYGSPLSRLPAKLAKRERDLEGAITATSHRSDAAFKSNDKPGFTKSEEELSHLKEQQATLVAELRRDYPEYASALYPRPVHVEEVRLEPGEVILEFEVTAPYTKAFVVRDGKVALSYDVHFTREELGDLVRTYRSYFEGVQDAAALAAYDPKLGHRLYQALLEPARKAIPAGSKLIVIPDEILGILPFESLVVSLPERLQSPSGAHGPAPVGVRYAADDFDISYAQSSTSLTEMRTFAKRGAAAAKALVLADPIFNPADTRLRGTPLGNAALDPDAIRTMGAIGRTMGLGGSRQGVAQVKVTAEDNFLFPRLDKTSVLAQRLIGIFGAEKTDSLIGEKASEAGLAKLDLSGYQNIVFATHGILDGTVSGIREPALVLDQIGNVPPSNGFLTMSKIMGLRLNADVVALTACETGLGDRLTGEGVMGLGRAFQYAGARNVLVSLWNVAEDSTTLFGEKFFQHLREGKSKRDALRLARADLRREGYEHPFYWAPFILIGQ
jgi:CHAT domain-containing protein